MKIYIASSWENAYTCMRIAYFLREVGFEVDCFCDFTQKGRYIFSWQEIVKNKDDMNAIELLKDERTQRAFREDKKWLDWADTVILVLPAGNSAHLEAGYAKGQGKRLYIVGEFPKGEFDVMYGFADLMTDEIEKVIKELQDLQERK